MAATGDFILTFKLSWKIKHLINNGFKVDSVYKTLVSQTGIKLSSVLID